MAQVPVPRGVQRLAKSQSGFAAGYDERTGELTIVFPSGRSYVHTGVPPDVYKALSEADSPGGYYARAIKGNY